MTDIRIEDSGEGKLFYRQLNPDDVPEVFTQVNMNDEILNYWVEDFLERRFVVPFWRAERLIAKSNLNKFAFKVTNIETPSEVDAEWVSFDSDLVSDIENDNIYYTASDSNKSISVIVTNLIREEDVAYFVIGNDVMDVFRQAYATVGDVSDDAVQDRTLSARIGRIVTDVATGEIGETVVFFILSETIMHDSGGNAGGPSTACGAKIPPRQ